MIAITDEEFRIISKYIKAYSGIYLKHEKKNLLIGRLSNLLLELGMDSFTEYYNFLKNDKEGKELSRLIDKITTNHTYFMRESEHFSYFAETVLPFWEELLKDGNLRVWCAACSSGEEPYTLAMIIEDYCKLKDLKWNKKLLATDISLDALNKAKEGIYSSDKITALSKLWKLNYFNQININSYQVKPSLKQEVIYRRLNLIDDLFPFKKKFHVVFCRNVMIYFDNETKEALINKIYDNMEYGGYLFVGYSESINRDKTNFKYIRPAVYRKL